MAHKVIRSFNKILSYSPINISKSIESSSVYVQTMRDSIDLSIILLFNIFYHQILYDEWVQRQCRERILQHNIYILEYSLSVYDTCLHCRIKKKTLFIHLINIMKLCFSIHSSTYTGNMFTSKIMLFILSVNEKF